jgi:hypothetical protein
MWRLARLSGNGLFTGDTTWDQAWYFSTWFVGNHGGFRIAAAHCSSDLAAPHGSLDAADLAAYLDLFLSGAPAADLADPVGVVNFFDLAAYIAAFSAGCP